MQTTHHSKHTSQKSMQNQYAQIEIADGIATVWLDQQNSSINKLSPDLISTFERMFDDLDKNSAVKAVVLISRKKDFIAGADLDAIVPITQPSEWTPIARKGHAILNKLANSTKPIVAAIHGAAMGGGLEVALACQYRIATDHRSTVLAQPEVKVGLLPGGGGTQRLPRLVGIRNALDMMLTGKNIYAGKAKKIGLVDKLVNEHALLRVAKEQALAMVGKKIVRKSKLSLADKVIEKTPIGRKILFDQARKTVTKMTKGNYPAPFKIIDCVEIGYKKGAAAGYETEVVKFDELVVHPVTKQLINLFFGMTDKKKNPLAEIAEPVKKIAMVGAGFMGAGISEVSALKGIDVILKDIKEDMLASAKKGIWKSISKKVRRKALTKIEGDQVMNHIHTQLDYTHFDQVDMVIEAVFEDIDLKHHILAQCEAVTHSNCIFASNTSALPITAIAAHARRPELVIGMHYFSPVPKMPLLEIVVTEKTADWVTATALDLGIRQGKTCIVVKDGPGFYTTRILAPLLNEALLLLEEGASIEQIDKCAEELGFPVGPVKLMDEVGIDVGAHIMQGELVTFFKKRGAFTMSDAMLHLSKAGYKGRKNRKGFYLYDSKGKAKKGKVNMDIYEFFGGSERIDMNADALKKRLLLIITNEAASCLQDDTLQSPQDGDLGAIFGLGYPPFTGGPFRYLDSLGCEVALKELELLAAQHGARFAPADIIREKAASGGRFYE